ncbi:MAG TPA: alpha/beta fold hydrolase [Mucilaginibacter sp.]|jgi:alpha-beta hydrolase superfamily lysophospholipase|nr:alpha/beta fold hydrolase [Mucilaginibacter sp.]
MKKIIKRVLYTLFFLVVAIVLFGLILAWLPTHWRVNNMGITPQEAAALRKSYTGPHQVFTTSDGETLFLRRWNPDTIDPAKKDIAVLIFHGFTAYSGPYSMAGIPISKGGYTVFGLDYRGHGLSGGNRGDSPGKNRWIADLGEAVKYVKSLGFKKVVVLGHSLGVASAICAADTVPDEIAGLILLSGAYEGRKGLTKPIPLFQQAKILASSIFRPSYPAVEYYRDGMTVSKDTLWNYRYTLRFLTMMDVKKLRLPKNMNIPVLVGVGDKDELFAIDKVKDFYNLIPGNKKEFFVMKNASHAKIPLESWEEIVAWLNKTYVAGPANPGEK